MQCVFIKICLRRSGVGSSSSSCSSKLLLKWLLIWSCTCCLLQKFAQSLLEVADNLESAQRAVPAAVLQPGAEVSTEKALGYLKALLEGVQATERVLLKVRPAAAEATAWASKHHPHLPPIHKQPLLLPAPAACSSSSRLLHDQWCCYVQHVMLSISHVVWCMHCMANL
jgi:hypothetical protein